jgi:hypothetical protein
VRHDASDLLNRARDRSSRPKEDRCVLAVL